MSNDVKIVAVDNKWQRVSIHRQKYIAVIFSGWDDDGSYVHYGRRRALQLYKHGWGFHLNYVSSKLSRLRRHDAIFIGIFSPLAAQAVAVELVKSQRYPMEVNDGRYNYDSSEQ